MLGNNDPLEEFSEACDRDKEAGKVVCEFESEDGQRGFVEVEQRPDAGPELDGHEFSPGMTRDEKEALKQRTMEQARKKFQRHGGALSGHTE